MNYRERMRKAVECPQFGNIDYGEWGSLNLIQRKDIKRLLDEMDRADEYIKTLYFKNENLQSKIDKANEIIKDWHQEYNGLMETNNIYIPKDKPSLFDLRDILKEDK